MSHTGCRAFPHERAKRSLAAGGGVKSARGATPYPGLLQRSIDAKRGKGYKPIPPLGTKYRRVKYSDGAIYETRPDGWRLVGFKA